MLAAAIASRSDSKIQRRKRSAPASTPESTRKRIRISKVNETTTVESTSDTAEESSDAKDRTEVTKRSRLRNNAREKKIAQSPKTTKIDISEHSNGRIPDQNLQNSRKSKKGATKTKTAIIQAEDIDAKSEGDIPNETKNQNPSKEEEEAVADGGGSSKKAKRKRKTKEEKEAEAMPLASRTKGLRMFIGAHVSIAKGVQNSVTNCVHIGGNAFALFLKSQRKWESPPLQDANRDQFRLNCADHGYDATRHVVPHGSYLVNLAQEDPDKAKQAYDCFLEDLHRCEALGIRFYNFHPGATGSSPRPAAIARIASALNRAHRATHTVTPLLENMAGSGTVIGSSFADLRDIISQVDDKSRVGVCLDTCHAFAAGHDLRSPSAFKKTLEEFDHVVGIKYLKALHLNDSKAPLGSRRDLHQNIGLGFLGLRAFWNVMNEKRFEGLPMVLETPIDRQVEGDGKAKVEEDKRIWAREIKLLEGLVAMDSEGDEFKKLEASLAKEGEIERKKYQAAFEKKVEKERRKELKTKDIGSFFRVGKGKAEGKGTPRNQDKESDSPLSEVGDDPQYSS
ncbi:MAG: hypothetical protein LQ342_001576 [Letrouitia transgressa]|nr:MAG: hypothetical protein LQ342_001576 [Letrouitia transgressa]